ncbi:MAG: hypothetical protein JSV24_03840, partial [Bacteroidales bacterium]
LTEVDEEKIENIRRNESSYSINIASYDRITPVRIGPVEILNPVINSEREKILDAVRVANDIVTAVPSVDLYEKGGIAGILRQGLSERKKPALVYASENHMEAAVILKELVFGKKMPNHIRFADTVIERMGGPHFDKKFIKSCNLSPVTPAMDQALLVEDFDRIIVEKTEFKEVEGFSSLFNRFHATHRINMFEELKLLGHNAVHFLLGCLAGLKGYRFISEYNGDSDFGLIGVDALLHETGGWFKEKYRSTGEQVATEQGFREWTEQLCRRIVNPFLYDLVPRVIRDPGRKLGWNDRITSTIREAIRAGIQPRRYFLGIASALFLFDPDRPRELVYKEDLTVPEALRKLKTLWENQGDRNMEQKILNGTKEAVGLVKAWKESGKKQIAPFLKDRGYL